MRPSLEAILDLAWQASRSPYARRVLHDALLERYGAAYEDFVARVQQISDSQGPVVVTLLPWRLRFIDGLFDSDPAWPGLFTAYGSPFRVHALHNLRHANYRGVQWRPGERVLMTLRKREPSAAQERR